MNVRQASEHEHDGFADDHGYIPIGEVRSEDDGQLASLTLFELGIPCDVAHGESEVDEIRRFLEGWHAGQQLLVEPQNAARALAAVGPRLAPTQIWTDTTLYLKQLPTEHLVKLLDFRAIWKDPTSNVVEVVEQLLASRGVVYPPDGACSRALPAVFWTLILFFGPLASLLVMPNINSMKRTQQGGTRPRYDEKTRQRLLNCVKYASIAWCAFYAIAFLAIEVARPKRQKQPAPPVSRPPASL